MSNPKKSKKKIIIPISAAALLTLAAAFLYLNPHYLFIAGEYLGVNRKSIKITEITPADLAPVTLAELKEKDNTEFNQTLMLISEDYPLPDDFSPEISEYKDTGAFMDPCMQEKYAALSAEIKEKFDQRLYISSDFRTKEQQEQEYQNDPTLAEKPGCSEHQAGLALDLYVKYYAGKGFIKSKAGQYVNSHCHEYGFIIRYPVYGKSKTGFEPWHIRYLGDIHAKIIYNNRLTLEDYIFSLKEGVWYQAEGCLISRQKENSLLLPKDYEKAVISPDNTGYYIITVTTEKEKQ